MALITCPECNGQISDSVKQCIHCGAKITVCPECKKVYISTVNICTDCGFSIKKEEKEEFFPAQDEDIKQTKKTAKKIAEQYSDENAVGKIYFKFSKLIRIVLIIVSLLFLALAVKELIAWASPLKDLTKGSLEYADKSLTALFTADETLKTIKNNLLISVIFFIAFLLFDTCIADCITYTFYDWLTANKVNIPEVINYTLSKNLKKLPLDEAIKESIAMQFMVDSELYKKNDTVKYKMHTNSILSTVLCIIEYVFLLMFVNTNVENIMREIIENGYFKIWEIDISIITDVWKIIAFAGCIIVMMICDTLFEADLKKYKKAWAKNNLGNNAHLYEKYALDDFTTDVVVDHESEF